MKLKTKFILPLSILVTVGMIVVAFVLDSSARREIQSSAIEEMEQLDDAIVRSVDNYHESLAKDATIFSEQSVYVKLLEGGGEGDRLLSNEILKQSKGLSEGYESIFLADLLGNVIASSDESMVGSINVADRDYFQEALKGESYIGNAALSKVTGNPINVVSFPIKVDRQVIGVLAVNSDLTKFLVDFIDPISIGNTGYIYIYDNTGAIVSHPDKSRILKSETKANTSEHGQNILKEKNGVYVYSYNGDIKTMVFRQTNVKGWYIVATAESSDLFSGVSRMLRVTVLIIMFVLLVMIAIIWFLVTSVVNPIKLAVTDAQLIAEGDLTRITEEKFLKRRDELGELANAFSNMIRKLSDVVVNVRSASDMVTQGSEQLASASEEASQGATEQASVSEEVSSSMEEMGASIQQNADDASKTEKIAIQVARDAEEGGSAVTETVEAMKAISEKVTVINDIARNTNMLSLNASIEAARAGEQGKGFAVVAAEVGKLAANSQNAATEIFELASNSVGKAERANELIAKIVADIKNTAELVQGISSSSMEQNSGAEQVNSALNQLDQAIQTNAATAEETSSMSEELSQQAENLKNAIDFFKINNIKGESKTEISYTTRRENGRKSTGVLPVRLAAPETNDNDFDVF